MTYLVKITAEAEREADSILEWLLSQHAGDAALQWFAALEDAIESLSQFPKRCMIASENSAFVFEVRQLLYGHPPHVYRILFMIDRDTVYVLHLRHGLASTRKALN